MILIILYIILLFIGIPAEFLLDIATISIIFYIALRLDEVAEDIANR